MLFMNRRLHTILDLLQPNIRRRLEMRQYIGMEGSGLRTFEVGQEVMVRDYRGLPKWKPGKIVRKHGQMTYYIVWKRHIDQIR